MTRAARLAVAALLFLAAPLAALQQQAPQPPAAAGTDPAIEQQVKQLASELRCPVCQGVSIEASPTELSLEMKGVIRDQLSAGRTPDEVKAYFVERYGEWILLQPPAKGFNLVAYLLPVLALLGGLVVVVVMLRRWTAPLPEDETTAAAAPADAPRPVPDID